MLEGVNPEAGLHIEKVSPATGLQVTYSVQLFNWKVTVGDTDGLAFQDIW